MDATEAKIVEQIDKHREEIIAFARDIYTHAELGYKEFYETEKDMCNYLKGELILDEFSEYELKTFENVDNYTLECIENFKELYNE